MDSGNMRHLGPIADCTLPCLCVGAIQVPRRAQVVRRAAHLCLGRPSLPLDGAQQRKPVCGHQVSLRHTLASLSRLVTLVTLCTVVRG